MRYILFPLLLLIIAGCNQIGSPTGRYTLFETSKGVVYRLDTISGESEIIYSPTGWPKLSTDTLYEGEDGKTFKYLGGGKLKELSTTEAADILVEKYAK